MRPMGVRGTSNQRHWRPHRRGVLAHLVGLLSVGSLVLLIGAEALAELAHEHGDGAIGHGIKLRCQIGTDSWSDCRMVIDTIGVHWWLVVGDRRFEFRHDGRGSVTMAEGALGPKTVMPQWRSTGVLCWDGICAEGAIPLD